MVEEEEEAAEDQGSLTPSLGKQKPLLIHKLEDYSELEEVVILARGILLKFNCSFNFELRIQRVMCRINQLYAFL